MLDIVDLHVEVAGKPILKGLTLSVGPGEIHAIMGPNGSGKSTLANVLAGREGYDVTQGSMTFQGQNLIDMEPEERAAAGMFLAFQYPVEIPGVNNTYFLKAALNAVRKHRGEQDIDAVDFLALMKSKITALAMNQSLLNRGVNEGFSGGEKKRNEILQMTVLEPALCVLDEIDSGLDIDALKHVADGVNMLRSPQRSMIMVTHYQRLLDHIVPDRVHVLSDGKIIHSGDAGLAQELEAQGYGWLKADAS